MQITLTRLNSTNKNLRTNVVVGETDELPIIGKSFLMTAPPLESGNLRVIATSPVKSVGSIDGKFRFSTENSEYELKVEAN